MEKKQSLNFADIIANRSQRPGILLVVIGCLLIFSSPCLVWVLRSRLSEVGPEGLKALWHGAGGLVLLDFTAGLPLGAILVAWGGVRLFNVSSRIRPVLLPILGIYLLYFVYHAISIFRYHGVPFALFAGFGFLCIILFLALVWVWVRRRSGLELRHQRAVDLQMAGGLCFFTAAWEACGLVGAPGFAVYPELVERLSNQSFLIGQTLAVQFFIALGLIFLLLGMRSLRT